MGERVGEALEKFRWWLEGRVVTYEAAGEIARKVVSDSVCGGEDDHYRPRVIPLFTEPTKLPRRDLPSTVTCSGLESDGGFVICAAMGTDRCRKFGGIGQVKRLRPDLEKIREEGRVSLLSLIVRKSS